MYKALVHWVHATRNKDNGTKKPLESVTYLYSPHAHKTQSSQLQLACDSATSLGRGMARFQ
jgi:hypothetical protein